MKLILITYPDCFESEALILNELFDKYTFGLHLRKPGASEREICQLLDQIKPAHYSKIVIHNHPEIARVYGIRIHTSGVFRDKIEGAVSTSFHSIEEAMQYDGVYEYVFLSPIFSSISKYGYEKNWNRGELMNFLQKDRKTELIALGGIDENRITEVAEMGFDGCALLGAVWSNTNELDVIRSNFSNIYCNYQKLNHK
ncbi:thiamine phosphate synthase [Prolixibacteraceae bacterium JC049]|nr:thiamine phosphate synthase [Prolixibacteraceae bacterium JC049]